MKQANIVIIGGGPAGMAAALSAYEAGERDILIPAPEGSGKPFEVLRPDRVMVSGDRAVVLDYKFGQREEARHRRQVGRYMALLREMGYREVKGYLWYLQNGSVDEVLA